MPHKHKIKGQWTGQWLGQVKQHGVRRRKLCPSKDAAKAWEVEMKRRGNTQVLQAPESTQIAIVCLLEWAEKYLDYPLRYSPKTYSEKRNSFRRLLHAFGGPAPVETLKPGAVLEYLQTIFHTRSGHAANKERKNLVAAWNFGCRYLEGFPTPNPFVIVPKFPETSHPRYVPPQDDFWKVVEVAEGQERVLLLAFLHTAARRGELYRLTWADIDFGTKRLELTTRKRKDGSLERDQIPMTDELCHALMSHRQSAINEWVFIQIEGRHAGKPYVENRGFPQELCRTAGVKPFGCHAIRHLTASILAQKNTPMVAIQAILRHRKLATTERYVRGLEPVRPYLRILEGGLFGQRSHDGFNTSEKGLRVVTSSPLS
jgi:integrase